MTAGGTILSHTQVVARWVAFNRSNATPAETDLPDIANDGTSIRQHVYTGVANPCEVVSYVIQNGGQTWSQGYQYLAEFIIGKTSLDMNGCEIAWAFFKMFKR